MSETGSNGLLEIIFFFLNFPQNITWSVFQKSQNRGLRHFVYKLLEKKLYPTPAPNYPKINPRLLRLWLRKIYVFFKCQESVGPSGPQ